MFSQTTPSGGKFDSDLFADQTEDGPCDKRKRPAGDLLCAVRLR